MKRRRKEVTGTLPRRLLPSPGIGEDIEHLRFNLTQSTNTPEFIELGVEDILAKQTPQQPSLALPKHLV
jgi:hypothetical protein